MTVTIFGCAVKGIFVDVLGSKRNASYIIQTNLGVKKDANQVQIFQGNMVRKASLRNSKI